MKYLYEIAKVSMKPRYSSSRYRVYVNVTRCTSCGIVGQYEDAHPVNPCSICGNKLEESVGRYVKKKKKKYIRIFNLKIPYSSCIYYWKVRRNENE